MPNYVPIFPKRDSTSLPDVMLEKFPDGAAGDALKSLQESGDVIVEPYALPGKPGKLGVWLVRWEMFWEP